MESSFESEESSGSLATPEPRPADSRPHPRAHGSLLTLAKSTDKLGSFYRSAADCTIILDAIRGRDPNDPSSRDIPPDNPFRVYITKLTVGYLDDAEMEVVHVLSSKGVTMVPFKLNYTVDSVQGILNFTMDSNKLAHFDERQRLGKDDQYEAQEKWPIELRRARVVPAVDHVQALALAIAYQSVTDHHKHRPPINDLGPNDWTPNAQSKRYPPRQLHLLSFLMPPN